MSEDDYPAKAEFHFVRMEYADAPFIRGSFYRGWWRQDWPESDMHFTQGVKRLTRIDTGGPVHLPLTDDRVFDFPWIYATQTGYWSLGDGEVARLREYLLRGGFLVTDDFWGAGEWAVFEETMRRVLPDQPPREIEAGDALMHTVFDITELVQIPGLRHLRRGAGGTVVIMAPPGEPPHWRAIEDRQGRMVVAAGYNMDVGDAWEHADLPEYPERMTTLAYRFGINYILYAMTH